MKRNAQLLQNFLQVLRVKSMKLVICNELRAPLDVSKGCEALCPEEVEDYGFL